MTIELTMLTYSVGLLVIVIAIQATAGILAQGVPAMAGSRDNLGEPSQFQSRSKRVAENHKEGLLLFAPLVVLNMDDLRRDKLTRPALRIYRSMLPSMSQLMSPITCRRGSRFSLTHCLVTRRG